MRHHRKILRRLRALSDSPREAVRIRATSEGWVCSITFDNRVLYAEGSRRIDTIRELMFIVREDARAAL